MKIEKVKFKSAGDELIGEINFPDKFEGKLPTVILFHGLTNSRKDCPLINETSQALTENGFVAFRFDFYGSGESPCELRDKIFDILEQNAKDAIEFILKDERVDENRLGLWGRSLGGTLICLLPPNPKIKARVSASGALLFKKIMLTKFKKVREKELELEKEGKSLPGTGKYKGPFEFKPAFFESLKGLDNRTLKNIRKLNRVLVLGTAQDQKVPVENACLIVNNAKEPKRIWIFNTDHDYAGVEEKVVKETIDWFKKYL